METVAAKVVCWAGYPVKSSMVGIDSFATMLSKGCPSAKIGRLGASLFGRVNAVIY